MQRRRIVCCGARGRRLSARRRCNAPAAPRPPQAVQIGAHSCARTGRAGRPRPEGAVSSMPRQAVPVMRGMPCPSGPCLPCRGRGKLCGKAPPKLVTVAFPTYNQDSCPVIGPQFCQQPLDLSLDPEAGSGCGECRSRGTAQDWHPVHCTEMTGPRYRPYKHPDTRPGSIRLLRQTAISDVNLPCPLG